MTETHGKTCQNDMKSDLSTPENVVAMCPDARNIDFHWPMQPATIGTGCK